MDESYEDNQLNRLKEFCSEHGYDDPALTKNQAITIRQYVELHDRGFLVQNLSYISQCGESYAPAFRRFLADVIDGKLKRPNHRPVDFAKKSKVLSEMDGLIELGHSLQGKAKIDGIVNEYGIVGHLASKHGVSDGYVKTLLSRYREDVLESYRRHWRFFHPEHSHSKIEALAIQDFKKHHPNLPLPSKKE